MSEKMSRKEYQRKYYLEHREEILARNAARWEEKRDEILASRKEEYLKEENYPRYMIDRARGRARKKGIEFTITAEDITPIPKFCPILGIPLVRNLGGKTGNDNSPSIDRIDPTKGYVPGNVQVVSHKANWIKGSATLEELRELVNWVIHSKWLERLESGE